MSHIRQFFQILSFGTILNVSVIAAAAMMLSAGFSLLDNPNISKAMAGMVCYGSMILIMLGTIIMNQMFSNIRQRLDNLNEGEKK